MELLTCPECSNEISESTMACVNCGNLISFKSSSKRKAYKGVKQTLFGILFLSLGTYCIFFSSAFLGICLFFIGTTLNIVGKLIREC